MVDIICTEVLVAMKMRILGFTFLKSLLSFRSSFNVLLH